MPSINKALKAFIHFCAFLAFNIASPITSAQISSFQATPSLSNSPLKIVVPYPPGGGTDIISRSLSVKLSEALHVNVIIDNRNGANGTIGTAYVAKSPPDGSTLLVVPAGYAANPFLYSNLNYDQSKDLAPVSLLASGPLILVTHPDLNVHSVKELVALAKTRPNGLNVGSAGNGSLPHLSAELFNLLAGVKMIHVPYKGAGPAVLDLLAGNVPVYFMNVLQALPLIKSGKLRALGVTSLERFNATSDLAPIASELAGFDMSNWYGMLAPANTPKELINRLQSELALILRQPAIKEKLDNEGMSVVASTPNQFEEFLKRESDKYAKIITNAGVKGTY
jgi:tripartite-type tricarboxylate transporter receptor subunit TctC